MDDFEKKLGELLSDESDLAGRMDEAARKEMTQMIFEKFELDMFKVKVVFWIFLAVSTAMMVGGMIFLTLEKGVRGMLFAAVIALIGYNSTILMKLWYWVVSTKLSILKELKQMQLQMAELAGKESSSQSSSQN